MFLFLKHYIILIKKSWKEKNNIIKEIKVSKSILPLVVVSRSHLDEKTQIYLKSLKNYKIEKKGSSLKFFLVAEGIAQMYPRFGNTYIWDTAACHAILISAGGTVETRNRKKIIYSLATTLINPGFYAHA